MVDKIFYFKKFVYLKDKITHTLNERERGGREIVTEGEREIEIKRERSSIL